MIRLEPQEKEFLKQHFQHVKVHKDKIVLQDQNPIVIPSELYPVQNKKHIRLFSYANTVDIEHDSLAEEAFNSVEFMVGHCYTNTMKLAEAFLERGASPKDVQPYVGWIIIDKIPVHHSWMVYKNIHLLDGGMSKSDMIYFKIVHEKGITDIEQQRQILVDLLAMEKGRPNSEVKVFGRSSPLYVYVGAKCNPVEGLNLFRKLISKYPNHPIYSRPGMSGQGASRLQEMLLRKLMVE